jgi:hypothetical protein
MGWLRCGGDAWRTEEAAMRSSGCVVVVSTVFALGCGRAPEQPGSTALAATARRDGPPSLVEPPAPRNPLSPIIGREDNPGAAAWDGVVLRDGRRQTRALHVRTRAEAHRGVVVQRPLLVFLESDDGITFDRSDHPLPKGKSALVEEFFGRGFDYHDPASVAGWYYEASGGRVVITGDASSVLSLTMTRDELWLTQTDSDGACALQSKLLALQGQLDLGHHDGDGDGLIDPIVTITPVELFNDQSATYGSFGAYSYMDFFNRCAPALTDAVGADGRNLALWTYAVTDPALTRGWHTQLGYPVGEYFGKWVTVHELGHAFGFAHPQTDAYGGQPGLYDGNLGPVAGYSHPLNPFALNRYDKGGVYSSVMSYNWLFDFLWDPAHIDRDYDAPDFRLALDTYNRWKAGWGNPLEVSLDPAQPGRPLGPRQDVVLEEMLGRGPGDAQPQLLKINLPDEKVRLFAGLLPPTGAQRMIWSGLGVGASSYATRSLHVPAARPTLSFWTRYQLPPHGELEFPFTSFGTPQPGSSFGYVQVSADGGNHWTSLPATTSTTYVDPNVTPSFVGQDLGAPAFTGSSDDVAGNQNGWLEETVDLGAYAGQTVELRFNFSNNNAGGDPPQERRGWWIGDLALGGARLEDWSAGAGEWSGVGEDLASGLGWSIVGEEVGFRHFYLFELRGQNVEDATVFGPIRKQLTGEYGDWAAYAYDPGLVGTLINEYNHFTQQSINPFVEPISEPLATRVRRDPGYPIGPEDAVSQSPDWGALLFPDLYGLPVDDDQRAALFQQAALILTSPHETFARGFDYLLMTSYPSPDVPMALLDAHPSFEPESIVGEPGGWPFGWTSADPLGFRMLGQRSLLSDAAFSPAPTVADGVRPVRPGNPVFDDSRDDYRHFKAQFDATVGPRARAVFHEQVPELRAVFDDTGALAFVPTGRQVAWPEQIVYLRMLPWLVNFIFVAETLAPILPECSGDEAALADCLMHELMDAGRAADALDPDAWASFYTARWGDEKAPPRLYRRPGDDPRIVANGPYGLRVTVADVGGAVPRARLTIEVATKQGPR